MPSPSRIEVQGMETKERMMCLSELKENGFNQKLIDELLPEPTLKQNSRYKKAAPMKLWHEDDVKKAMETQAYKDYQAVRAKRQAAAEKAINTKTEKLMDEVKTAIEKITVKRIDIKKLKNKTISAKQAWYAINGYERAAYNADEETVNRWMVNYIRHNYTEYENDLESLFNRVGKTQAYVLLKNAILDKIAAVYPELEQECKSQMLAISSEKGVEADAETED